ncbi:MAG: ribonucleoside-diphosphate reductase subunit alpha [Rickettsiales bacterium]|nr:ribonucleoside-diphosphate reductase subunit alpha [Rickettsiales bacterium]
MIKYTIKRNGQREEFDPNKINGWGIWASQALGSEVAWSEIVLHVFSIMPEEVTTEQLQNALIKACIDKRTWKYSCMAGRLYAALAYKQLYGKNNIPTVEQLHQRMFEAGLMVKLNYSKEDYAYVQSIINHDLDFKSTQYELQQLRYKYALRNKKTGQEFETPQFVYMRMAMALAEEEPGETRLQDVTKWYEHFSHKRINPPTPNFTNLGTNLRGYASCCLYTVDDNVHSLATGDHIAYIMTAMSAGIGAHMKTRSIGDHVRQGLIEHQGKLPYYKSLVGAIGANLQNGRGGAATVHYTCFDPEVEVIHKLKNPMTPANKQVRGCDYSFGSNKFFARKVARNEDIALFSYVDVPELYESQYDKDQNLFEKLYNKFLESDKPKTMVSARKLLINVSNEAYETGRHYIHLMDSINKHTPFKEKIYSSNLCQEICEPTKPYKNVAQLYEAWNEDHGEIALCNLAGIIVSNIENDEQYADVAYYALKMIDKTISLTKYTFKSLEDTSKARMNAGVGVLGLAHLMAKKDLKYSSQAGKNFIHELFETHYWHLLNASLCLGKELGNAKWMDKTLWPEGWLPLDTYEKNVDELVTTNNKRDWESLRKQIIANKGIRNSVLTAHMPGESSTIAAGTTNSVYPIRDFDLIKTSETMSIDYVVPDSVELRNQYELAWNIPTQDMIDCYAIMQKWTDQAISADLWRKVQGDEKVGTKEMIDIYLRIVKYGMKTRYYLNSLTAKGIDLNSSEKGCESGVCSL